MKAAEAALSADESATQHLEEKVGICQGTRVFSGLAFSGFSSFRAFQNFVRVSGWAFGLLSGSFQALKA